MDGISNAITKVMTRFKQENGENAKLEDGETIHGIFKDGVVSISIEEEKLNIDITLGEPYMFDENLETTLLSD